MSARVCPECQTPAEPGVLVCPCGADIPALTRYAVNLTALADFYVEVMAEDEESAIDMAFEMRPQETILCHQCHGLGRQWSLDLPEDDACWDTDIAEVS